MNTINWSGYEWLTQERWGIVHKDKPYCWYDPSAVQITLKGYLDLKTQYNPKEFPVTISTSKKQAINFYHGVT